ncbi:MAG: hypothetical protein AMK74_00180 [Nitrospira bacterium SM23_35]|nr:MAG: hypothetical protein AMK74_00180 [Nitrospira bacterium SM23_35]
MSLFTAEEISARIPAKTRISESGICDLCGELAKMGLLREIDGQKVCIPCAGARVQGPKTDRSWQIKRQNQRMQKLRNHIGSQSSMA